MIELLEHELDYLEWVQSKEIKRDKLLELRNANLIDNKSYAWQYGKIQGEIDKRRARLGY